MAKDETVREASRLLSTEPSELKQPPAEVESEAQEEPVKAEETAAPEASESEQETLESSDTEAEVRKFKVKVDGEELEVDEEELLKGYSRESHYQKKAKDLAQERDKITSKSEELDRLLSDAELIVNDKKARLDSDELKELRDDDPDAYLREVDKINADIEKFEAISQKRAQELQAQNEKLLAKERELLINAFPEWSNPEVMTKEATELLGTLKELGYSDSELDNITDHRMFVLARKAQRFDEIDSASLEAKEVKTKPKSVTPSVKEDGNSTSSQTKKAKESFLKSKRGVREAAALFSQTS